jgi:hypothetical protein
MTDHRTNADREAYAEYERKWRLIEDGPTTTIFEQLVAGGVELPPPPALADENVHAKIWEIIAELAQRTIYLDHTDHLGDRELYAKLWNDILREEVPMFNEFGNNFVQVLRPDDEADMKTYLKFFADDTVQSAWGEEDPEFVLPDRETPPYNRDALLPPNNVHGWPEASQWLGANWSPSAFASNRFGTTALALEFVERLYSAGAEGVGIDNVTMLPRRDWTPYADTLIVKMPEAPSAREALMEMIRSVGQPDDIKDDPARFGEKGRKRIRLRWN